MYSKVSTHKKKRLTIGDILIYFGLFLIIVATLYPFIYILSMSVSDPMSVVRREIWLLPKGFHLGAYTDALYSQELLRSYGNTIWYTFFGTIINVVLTMTLAYPMSRRSFSLRKVINLMAVITMFISGGIIPLFVVVNQLKLYNTRFSMIFPVAINTFNLIIARTFLEELPVDISEAAYIDGANDLTIFLRIVLPLAMPAVAVLTLYYAVAHWNTYFTALLYLPDAKLQPMQIYLRKILIQQTNEGTAAVVGDSFGLSRAMKIEQMKYSSIIITTLPILIVYPFLQKYFVQGVMIGALKG